MLNYPIVMTGPPTRTSVVVRAPERHGVQVIQQAVPDANSIK